MTTSKLLQLRFCHLLQHMSAKCLDKTPRIAHSLNRLRHAIIKRMILADCEIDSGTKPPQGEINDASPIYVMWWQGEDAMPEVVRICYESIKRNCGKHPVQLITRDNIHEYISRNARLAWNQRIDHYVETGRISIAHLGDLIRTWILYNFGGIWVDATLFFPHQDIDSMLLRRDYYSRTLDKRYYNNMFVPEGRWASFFIATAPYNPLMKNIHNGILSIILNQGYLYEYFSMDYIWALFYDRNEWLRNYIEQTPHLNPRHSNLDLNAPYDADRYKRQIAQFPCFKLTYKTIYQTITPHGEESVYGHIKRHYLPNTVTS